jgi:hypothetical protein
MKSMKSTLSGFLTLKSHKRHFTLPHPRILQKSRDRTQNGFAAGTRSAGSTFPQDSIGGYDRQICIFETSAAAVAFIVVGIVAPDGRGGGTLG